MNRTHSGIRNSTFALFALFRSGASLVAANLDPAGEKLVLAPAHPEIPPSFWEAYGVWLILGALLLIGIAVLLGWWWLRPKRPTAIPIEVLTREKLSSLRQRPEDGQTLSEISRCFRSYLAVAFELPPQEMTTSEFCQLLSRSEKLNPELAARAGEFLRRCDEVKFAPTVAPTRMGAAESALQLVDAGEARRTQLRLAAASPAQT